MAKSALDVTVLNDVFEPFPTKASNHGNYLVRYLSFFSTEQKTLDQAAELVAEVRAGTWAPDSNRKRYFNTLRNNGILGDPVTAPVETPLSAIFYEQREIAKRETSGKFTKQQKQLLDRAILENALDQLAAGNASQVSVTVRQVIRNIQQLFETLSPAQIQEIISSDILARSIQSINIEGSEPARYFRLPPKVRAKFDGSLSTLLSTREKDLPAALPPNARAYHEAAARVQADARIRVQDALLAYRDIRSERGDDLPYLGVDLETPKHTSIIRSGTSRPATGISLEPVQLIVSGCPGSGKSFWIDKMLDNAAAKVYRIQFHAELGFSEFVGSFRPRTLYEETTATFLSAAGALIDIGRPAIDYAFMPGPFTDALVEAYNDTTATVVVVIEEINRGNAAAAFGELFQALDRDDEGRSQYPVVPQADYADYLAKANALWNGHISLPPNLFIWASMNGADQNVHPLDTAFRRRWSYRYMGYTEPCLYAEKNRVVRYGDLDYDWELFRQSLNETLIGLAIDEDKLIGAYFLSPRQLRSPDEVLSKLFLYLWDDVLRFNRSALFSDLSFAKVSETWDNGHGAPLLLDLSGVAVVSTLDAVGAPAAEQTEATAQTPVEATGAAASEDPVPLS